MNNNNMHIKLFCLVFAVITLLMCNITAFAVDDDDIQGSGEIPAVSVVEPEPETEPEIVQPETEYIYTEPVYTEPEITEPVYTEPIATEPAAQEETQGQGNINSVEPPTEEFVPPTLPKTVSTKQYSTNYTAGILSWICVAVGIIVVAVVMISTKVSGRKETMYR